MFRVGDGVVVVSGGYLITREGSYGVISEIRRNDVTIDFIFISGNIHYADKRWIVDVKDIVKTEVYNSPLYKLMKENND